MKEFAFNRCPSYVFNDGQMMTPNRESCCGAMSSPGFPNKSNVYTHLGLLLLCMCGFLDHDNRGVIDDCTACILCAVIPVGHET